MRVHHTTEGEARAGEKEFFLGEVKVQPVVASEEGLDIILVRFSGRANVYHARPQSACTMPGHPSDEGSEPRPAGRHRVIPAGRALARRDRDSHFVPVDRAR
jgi:hypothetical protein